MSSKKQVDLAVIEDLILNKGYVFLVSDSKYNKDTKNSIKDHFGLTTIQAQNLKKEPVIQAFIKSMQESTVELIDSRNTPKAEEVKEDVNNESVAPMAMEMV